MTPLSAQTPRLSRNPLNRLALAAAVLLSLAGITSAESARGVETLESTQALNAASLNRMVLRAVQSMPTGGGYSTNGTGRLLASAIQIDADRGSLNLDAEVAKPSFCSGATYLVLLNVLEQALKANAVALPPTSLASLKVAGQSDGEGIWGRWNANGPGTAKLFHDLQIGVNFTGLEHAVPGDFLKIFWTDEIGSRERGHSVIFMGTGVAATGEKTVRFWSSNQGEGYGEKAVPLSKAKRMLFSRLTNVRALENISSLPAKDQYLAAMLKRPSTPTEMHKVCGVHD
jgi:hypothetical protein